MLDKRISYLKNQLRNHIRLFFTSEAVDIFQKTPVFYCRFGDLDGAKSGIFIPTDIPVPKQPDLPYRVLFNETTITLWNRVDNPNPERWKPIPDETKPIWYRHESGALCPAWNLFGNLFSLLAFQEELQNPRRDIHGRFVGAYSPRLDKNLLEIPAFNESVALLVAACDGLRKNNVPAWRLDGLVKPPIIVLSHDCDILRGNDIWTQSIRAYRIIQPILKGHFPHLRNFWWILRNFVTPRKFYFNEALGMITLERQFGYRSTFYLLNGTSGRFGARSGAPIIADLIKQIPSGWETGIHYNYDTYLNDELFTRQLRQIAEITGNSMIAGRAHYLRFHPEKSFLLWERFGLRVDESAGYPDYIGFRCGLGGIFQAYDMAQEMPLDIYEIPLIIMEDTLMKQYGDKAVSHFEALLSHMGKIGGALSMVIHPGMLRNPEFPQCNDFYYRILLNCYRHHAIAKTAKQLLDDIRVD